MRYLTPDTGDASDTITIGQIVLIRDYLPYFLGALASLAERENWEKWGTADVQEMVDYFEGVLAQIDEA